MYRGMCLWICLGLFWATLPAQGLAAGEHDPESGKRWTADLHLKRYVQSHTSYEFGNPFPPGQAPLSRLEFPMDSWWAELGVRRQFTRWSIGFEASTNLARDADGVFRDSDWEDEGDPRRLSIYSESSCRMERSWRLRGDADLRISDWLGLPPAWDVRPLVGIQWQRLAFLTHDGVQVQPPEDPLLLPGDGIHFRQDYWQYFLGLRGSCDLGRWGNGPRWKLLFAGHWAYVTGDNRDHHLLRSGERFTLERTTGDAWYAFAGLEADLGGRFSATVAVDWLRIRTTGSHRMENAPLGIDLSWEHGVAVWSTQTGVRAGLSYAF